MDPSAHHPEPFGEALSYSSQRAAQFTSLAGAAAEVHARRKAMRAAREAARGEQQRRELQEQERAARAEARARWAPAHDPRWLAQADLLQAGRVWGAAAPYADTDPDAASALRKAEERLRNLHPYAMARYDRLRTEGASELDAMREVANMFGGRPYARPGKAAAARPGIREGQPGASSPAEAEPWTGTSGQAPAQDTGRRGQDIASHLQARAQAERGSRLSPDELATALEQRTSLPAEVIGRLARAEAEERLAARAEHARAADLDHAAATHSARQQADSLKAARRDTMTADTAGAHASADRSAAQLAAESFPCTTADGIRAAVTGTLQQQARPPARTSAQNARRPGLGL